MKVIEVQDNQGLVYHVCDLLRSCIGLNSSRRLRGFFPTGKSLQPVYAEFRKSPQYWGNHLEVLQIDEFVIGEGLFYSQLERDLLGPLALYNHCQRILPRWSDAEMRNHIQQVLQTPPDLAILGLGPNGHIGFHEPDSGDETFLGGRVFLSKESYGRVAGAQSDEVLTFGAGAFLKCQKVLLVVAGKDKKMIYQQFLQEGDGKSLPACYLKAHPDLRIIVHSEVLLS